MNIFITLLFGIAIAAAFRIEGGIDQGIGQYWWVGIVVAYLLAGLDIFLRNIGPVAQRILTLISGLAVLAIILLFDNLLTVYLTAMVLLGVMLAGSHLEAGTVSKPGRLAIAVIGLLALVLIVLPVAINRVEVRLPNLSAGTYLSVVGERGDKQSLSAGFFNRSDDHLELTVHLGEHYYPGSAQPNPRLRIDILRDKIVVRLLSIRFQTQIGYFDKSLIELEGPALAELIALNSDSPARLQMEGDRLLISELRVGEPLVLSLPDIGEFSFSPSDELLSVGLRLLLLFLLVWAMVVWAPVGRSPTRVARA